MKRFFVLSSILIFVITSIFSQTTTYKIKQVNYNLTGCGPKFLGTTKPFALDKNVEVNKNKIFDTQEELDSYIKDYELRLNNTRVFEKVLVSYNYEIDTNNSTSNIIPVTLDVVLQDSIHILALPYPKYSSNEGFTLKLKIKDTNFLGSMNEMNTALNFKLEQKSESEKPHPSFGFEFGYDFPFKTGIFASTLVNDYAFSYTAGDESPEWKIKTGYELSYPTERIEYTLGFYQSFNRDFDYSNFNDKTYAGEEVLFKMPVVIAEIPNFSKIKYTPYINFIINWDLNKINIENSTLSSPYLEIGHSLSLNRVNWKDQLRTGIDATLSNYFKYNFQRNILYPEISLETKVYKSLPLLPTKNFMNRFGICADFYTFFDIYNYNNKYFKNDGTNIGERIRGLRDNQYLNTSGYEDWYALQTPAAIVLNLDFPIHIFQTDFQSKFIKYFNFDLQISPFMDIALTYNKATTNWFNPKDGLYAGGIEVLVYPLKWSSFTVRGSVGLDLGRYIFADKLNLDWRQNCSKYEISFGIGLHY